MASGKEFVQYAADQMAGAGEITYRKMFGEWGLYCDGKFFAVICDDQLFVKITDRGEEIAPDLSKEPPYEGARPYFLIDNPDDREFLTVFVRETCQALPEPKPKKKRRKAEEAGKAESGEKKKQKKTGKKDIANKAFDYKKEYKEFYLPPKKPGIIDIPAMNYIAVRGKGNPNEEEGEYKEAIGLLYAIAFTIKMCEKAGHKIKGYFSYVVPPLEGLWWQEEGQGRIDYGHKENFRWIALIRLPEFVTREEFDWAVAEAAVKKDRDFSKVEYFSYEEGLCVQCMHVGPYDAEPETIGMMEQFTEEKGYTMDLLSGRYHHEIYLSDPRRARPENLKTVIRCPVRKL